MDYEYIDNQILRTELGLLSTKNVGRIATMPAVAFAFTYERYLGTPMLRVMEIAKEELNIRKAKLIEQLEDEEAAEVMMALQLMGDK